MGSATMETVKAEEQQQQHFTGARTKKDILQREGNWKPFTSQRMASVHSCHTKATHSQHRLQQASACTRDMQQNRQCRKGWERIFRNKEVQTHWQWKQKRVENVGQRKKARGKEKPYVLKRGKRTVYGEKNEENGQYWAYRKLKFLR